MSRRHLEAIEQSNLFLDERKLPEGFAYREDVILVGDEQALLERFQGLSFKPFEFYGFLGNRRVVSFGWRYDFSGATLRPSDDIPPFLLPLRERAAAFAGIAAEGLQQILINEYVPGAGIGWPATSPCSRTWSPYRWARHAVCGCVAGRAAGGSAPHRRCVHAQSISCAGQYGVSGSIASRPSIACVIR